MLAHRQELGFNPCYNGSGVRSCPVTGNCRGNLCVSILVIMEVG